MVKTVIMYHFISAKMSLASFMYCFLAHGVTSNQHLTIITNESHTYQNR